MTENNDINPVPMVEHFEEWQRLAEIWGQERVEKALIAISWATDPDGKLVNLEQTGQLLETILPIISYKVTVDMPVLKIPGDG